MESALEVSRPHGFCGWLIRCWFALRRRKIRLLKAGAVAPAAGMLFAVGHPPALAPALALAAAVGVPLTCLLPRRVVRSGLARFLVRRLGFILYDDGQPPAEATLSEAAAVLASGRALAVFADQNAPSASLGPATTAATVASRAQAPAGSQRPEVHPVHLYLPQSGSSSREILIYVDSAVPFPAAETMPSATEAPTPALARAIEARFQENAFQLQAADLEYFLSDLEEILRTALEEDWAARPDWKQDTDGFALSRLVTEWAKRTNYLHPARLVSLRQWLDDYHRLERRCALREAQVRGAESVSGPVWRRALHWLETLLGFPLAIYGLANHALILAVLFLAGSFQRNNRRARRTEWILRLAVTLSFYILQVFLVGHWRGRAAAGYYAPSLVVSGLYLWRYLELIRPQAGPLFISLFLPALTRQIKRRQQTLLNRLDQAIASSE
jgi:hypothetical protein